ncbi:MAG: DUF5717 family protein [Lachnospiraceae bacterium]|nr:DUF5717 family protein [Lachnospiraceae bacterium]
MRDIISRILDGNYIQNTGSLNCQLSKVEIEVSCDCDYEGSFRVFTSDGSVADAFVISSDLRMEVLNPEIAGTEMIVSYHFHGDLCKPGDEIKGYFSIISDHGESSVPFDVRIEPGELESSAGRIRNLFSFVNLAKDNWNEAIDLFYSPKFKGILSGSDEYFMGMYLALSANPGNSQNLEEFLLGTGKKPKVEYFYEKKTFETAILGVEYSERLAEREIEILRNGWSYSNIDIEIEGDFLLTRREVLSDTDFTGNVCTLKLFIDTDKCLKGRREGRIILKNNFARLEIPVVVKGRSEVITQKATRSKAILLETITRDYILRGLGLMDEHEWFKKTGETVEKLSALAGNDVYVRLFKARLLCIEERHNEAGWLVDQAAEIIEHDEREGSLKGEKLLEAYAYHWLTASLVKQDKEFTKVAATKVEAILKKAPSNWQIGFIALLLPTTYNANTYTRWSLLEKLFEAGSRSAVIYYEGIKTLNENPMVAKKMDSFLIQTVYFGAKRGVVNQKCLEMVLSFSQRTKTGNNVHIHMLELLYEQYDDIRILQEICAQLIYANRIDKVANAWYRKAIEKDIKLTGLFEYFIQSIDLDADEDIPLVVLMYFGYRNNLGADQLAYFYYYIITHKDKYEELYEASIANMEFFANAEIAKGNVNKHLAVIYSDVFRPDLISRQQAIHISNILFSKWVVCERKDFERAYVYQKGCISPFVYELKEGEGAVCAYGRGYIIVFEDSKGNRYINSVKFSETDLMPMSKYLQVVTNLVWDNERLNMHIVGTGNSTVTVTSGNVSRFMQLGESEKIRPYIRRNMLTLAMEYYSNHDDENSFSRCFRMLGSEGLTAEQMGRLFPHLYRFGYMEVIRDWLIRFGPYFVGKVNLKRFLDREIKEIGKGDGTYDESAYENSMLAAAIHVFRENNADSLILEFLAKNFRGSSRELVEIRKALKEYNLPLIDIDRRIITRHLHSDMYIPEINEIAKECVLYDPTADISRAVIIQASYRYLAGRAAEDKNINEAIASIYRSKLEVALPSRLAFLKYYSERPYEMDDEAEEIVIAFLKTEIRDRIYLGFFKKFLGPGVFKNPQNKAKCDIILGEIQDRTIIDYRIKSGKSAKIHYVYENGNTESYDYASENMREVCGGICFKDFILFFGETLQYYITEEGDDEASLSDNGQVSCNNTMGNDKKNLYMRINDMLISNTTKDYGRFDSQYEDYNLRRYMNEELFRLL